MKKTPEIMEDIDSFSNGSAELVLLGHILNNMTLLEQYGHCLQESDFSDKGTQIFYNYIKDYYKNYGNEYTMEKSRVLFVEWKLKDKDFSRNFPTSKNFFEGMRTLQELGNTHALVDNLQYQAVKKHPVCDS